MNKMKSVLITALLVAFAKPCPGKPAYIYARSAPAEEGLLLAWSNDGATTWTVEYKQTGRDQSNKESVSVP
jgi:hypothetical protein